MYKYIYYIYIISMYILLIVDVLFPLPSSQKF